jgi:DNA-binding transcriptional regulator YdaS (Cro superfamily)
VLAPVTLKLRVREQLAAQERTEAWLARKLSISPSLLSHYLAGRRQIPSWVVPGIAEVLHVSVESLLEDDEAA